jgi:hypothetical protein
MRLSIFGIAASPKPAAPRAGGLPRPAALLAAAFLAIAGPAAQASAEPPPQVTAVIAGSPETVFDWSHDACAPDDFPDAPARAFRNADGQVRLIATHHVNRAMVGPTLGRVRPDCRVVFEAGHRDDPAAYGDRSWLTALHTRDGETVHALVHSEYHGWRRPQRCPPDRWHEACWYNTITWAVSRDGGRSFTQPPPAERLVAALPYRPDPEAGQRMGLFNPTNIVPHDGHFYAMVLAFPYGEQQRGYCLIRTEDPGDPDSWRAWDGEGFTVRFADPHRDNIADPAAHVCRPVAPGRLTSMVGSLTRHRPSGVFLAIVGGRKPPAPGAEPVAGVFVVASRDLITWSHPTLIWRVPVWQAGVACGSDRYSIGYPALLDPSSPSRTFGDTGSDAYVYFTRFNFAEDCTIGGDRDLVRVPVRIVVDPGN